MVQKDNPAHITNLLDLGQPKVRLAMPNPEFEGIARQIKASLQKADGEKLAKTVYEDKVHDGSTVLTHIHHRQTPLFLVQGVADAGVTWKSEAIFQEQVGHPISHVEIPDDQNTPQFALGRKFTVPLIRMQPKRGSSLSSRPTLSVFLRAMDSSAIRQRWANEGRLARCPLPNDQSTGSADM